MRFCPVPGTWKTWTSPRGSSDQVNKQTPRKEFTGRLDTAYLNIQVNYYALVPGGKWKNNVSYDNCCYPMWGYVSALRYMHSNIYMYFQSKETAQWSPRSLSCWTSRTRRGSRPPRRERPPLPSPQERPRHERKKQVNTVFIENTVFYRNYSIL